MPRYYNSGSKKDKYITDYLLVDLLQRADETGASNSNVKDNVYSMLIFPYKTYQGTQLGSLNDPGITWYYAPENDNKTMSSDSYRIFDDSVFKPDVFQKIRRLIDQRYISKYSETTAADELLTKMSMEDNYTANWWKLAYDLLQIRNMQKLPVDLSRAVEHIDNNYFLFETSYHGTELKHELLEAGIFRDIETMPEARKYFFDKLKDWEKESAFKMLEAMGIPCRFTFDDDGPFSIQQPIIEYVTKFGEKAIYPICKENKNYQKCELINQLFIKYIFKESNHVFSRYLNDLDKSVAKGVPVKNLKGDFIPFSWSLFYDNTATGSLYEGEQYTSFKEIKESIRFEKNYEINHVDVSQFDRKLPACVDTLIAFSEVNQPYINYDNVGGLVYCGDDIDFYKWVWCYSRHPELAEAILLSLSSSTDSGGIVKQGDNTFVFDVLTEYMSLSFANDTDFDRFSFRLSLSAEAMFSNAEEIQRISKRYRKVNFVLTDECTKFDVQTLIERIVNVSYYNDKQKQEIKRQSIWNRVYVMHGTTNKYGSTWLKVKKYNSDGNQYEDILALWPSDDSDSYIRCLGQYIRNELNYYINDEAATYFDWKQQYIKLVEEFRGFVSVDRPIRSKNSFSFSVVRADNIANFGDERRVWNRLINERKTILSCDTKEPPVIFDNREYLKGMYRGRCQLCSNRIEMDNYKTLFWTYRVVQRRDNELAELRSNLFCLCPSCHGQLRYGDYMGFNMKELIVKAKDYVKNIEEAIEMDLDDDSVSVISRYASDDNPIEGFHSPIICNVVVNGDKRQMAFTWEHFMRIAFMFTDF